MPFGVEKVALLGAAGAGGFELAGGTESESGGYKYYKFESTSTLEVVGSGDVDVLIVGSGCAGSNGYGNGGGGGGAGQFLATTSSITIAGPMTLTCTIGAGGTPACPGGVGAANTTSVSHTSGAGTWVTKTAKGGGNGGAGYLASGSVGGSGGGGGTDGSGGSSSANYYADWDERVYGGGSGGSTSYGWSAGGGGGAGQSGRNPFDMPTPLGERGGAGGYGYEWLDGNSYCAGGGGNGVGTDHKGEGGARNSADSVQLGGQGTDGATYSNAPAMPANESGSYYHGSGSGGINYYTACGVSGASGVVIFRTAA
jgi:hypothetical protein